MSVSGFCAKVLYVVAVVVLHSFCAPALLLVIVTNSATQLLRREIYMRVYAFKYGTIPASICVSAISVRYVAQATQYLSQAPVVL